MPFDLIGLVWVVIGSLLIATLQCGWGASVTALQSALPMHRTCPDADAADAHALIHVVRSLIARSGIWSIDQLAPKHPVMAVMLGIVIAHHDKPDMQDRLRQALHKQQQTYNIAIRWWHAVADAAPALGMAGTIFGMIRLFAAPGGDSAAPAAAQGNGLALALYTTFYGLILASIIAGPIAQRLAHVASANAHWQDHLAQSLATLVQRCGATENSQTA